MFAFFCLKVQNIPNSARDETPGPMMDQMRSTFSNKGLLGYCITATKSLINFLVFVFSVVFNAACYLITNRKLPKKEKKTKKQQQLMSLSCASLPCSVFFFFVVVDRKSHQVSKLQLYNNEHCLSRLRFHFVQMDFLKQFVRSHELMLWPMSLSVYRHLCKLPESLSVIKYRDRTVSVDIENSRDNSSNIQIPTCCPP